MRFKNVKYPYGTKSSARSVSFSLSPELKDEIDRASGGSGNRSNWVERWLWLAVGLQAGNLDLLSDWETWARENLDEDDRYLLQGYLDCLSVM